jgi:hypothetical protein
MTIYRFNPSYKKENGVLVFNEDIIPLPKILRLIHRSVAIIPPGAIGGNHKHPRVEAFFGIGELKILFVTDNMEEHAIINEGKEKAFLVEFANELQHDVENVNLV